MQVNINDVIDAIESLEEDERAYYNPKTEEIVYELEDDDDDVIDLPDKADRNDYKVMEHFIYTVENEEAQEWLSNAIVGKGAFRRFRAACEKFNLLQDWYDYQDKEHRALAIQWCEDNGIVWYNEKVEEEQEENLSDFFHEDYQQPKPVVKVNSHEIPVSIRCVVVTEKNLMNALYIVDEYRKEVLRQESDLEQSQAMLEEWLEQGSEVLAASESGRFIGIAMGKQEWKDYCIQLVYVNQQKRRQGIGRMLVLHLEKNRSETNKISLAISPKNQLAIQFFDYLGYTTVPLVMMKKEI